MPTHHFVIIDDDQEQAHSIHKSIQSHVSSTADFLADAEGLEQHLKRTRRPPDAFIVDLLLPSRKGESRDVGIGLSCIHSINQQHPGTPVIACSALDAKNCKFQQADYPEHVHFVQKSRDFANIALVVRALFRPDDQRTAQVFLVHGHAHNFLATVENFLRKVKLQPVVLKDKPGVDSILNLLETHGQVPYVVALLTADDYGRARSVTAERPRARQNVIFELGLFIGNLGAKRVLALVDPEVELPSDYSGYRYISIEAPDWQTLLLRELIDADLPVDPMGHLR